MDLQPGDHHHVAPDSLGLLEDGRLDPAWATKAFGFPVDSGCFVEDESGPELSGGLSGTMRRLQITRAPGVNEQGSGVKPVVTYVVKHSNGNLNMPGVAREADFYNEIAKELGATVPSCIYAAGDRSTGQKIIVLEDLSAGTQVGEMLGTAHPHTWGDSKEAKVLASTMAGPGPGPVLQTTFEAAAVLHAKFWRSPLIQDLEWVGGNRHEREEEWQKMMGWSQSVWRSKREGRPGLNISTATVAVIDASFAKLSWSDHLAFKESSAVTLIQGDFHPFNAMWLDGRVVLYDWEMIKQGSPGQELGQFMLGNVDVELRRRIEKQLVMEYHRVLVAHGVDEADCPAEHLWSEYVFGGAAKWVWLLPLMFTFMPEPTKMQWFLDQFEAFISDHGITPENIPQPRA